MGLGPVHAARRSSAQRPRARRHRRLGINEAFAAQVIACLRAFADDDYCRTHFGVDALGAIDRRS